MNTPSNAVPESPLEAQAAAPAALSATRPFYWSVRRELWENRYLYIVPLAAAAFVLFASSIHAAITLPDRMGSLGALEPVKQQTALAMPFSMAASVIFLITYIVGAFYCLDALYGERRDRSILFWKSLPVSDVTTVLSKATIPLVVLPLFIFTIAIATQLVLLMLSSVVLLVTGLSPAALWVQVPLFRMTLVMLYGLIVHALWHAPLYAWLLLVSAWSRRVPILWAVLPSVAISMVERMALGTSHFGSLIRYRLMGTLAVAFDFKAQGGMVPLVTPLKFLGTPGLWTGLVVATVFIAAAVRLRRYREPI
jgi:ABC-2 type transport system permease protein